MPLPAPAPTHSPAATTRAAEATIWTRVTWCAGLFLLIAGIGMLASHARLKANDPWKSPVLKELKERLVAAPKDEAIKQQIRDLDLKLRQRYFHLLRFNEFGIWLLLGGMGVFVTAASRVMLIRRVPPMPAPRPDAALEAQRDLGQSRWAIGVSGACITLAFASLTLTLGTSLPRHPDALQKLVKELGGESSDSPQVPDAASLADLHRNWPRFLGTDGNPLAATNAPLAWNGETSAGIAWKTAVPLPGFNSPIVWGDRVFLSGADKTRREVFCFNARTGTLAWRQPVEKVPGSPITQPDIPEMTGYAPASMATDGRRVYALFPNGDLVAFTLEGRLVWAKALGLPDNPYGHTSSLITWQDRLIIQLDQGEAEANKSRLIALNGRNGQTLWQRQRPVGASWASPTVFEAAGRAQIVALAVPWVIAYSAIDGTELWRVEGLHGEITPSPAFAAGLVLAVCPAESLMAIRPDGTGDVTKTHVVWTNNDGGPDVTSPVCSGELVFTLTTGGLLTCIDTKDGKKQWEKELDVECHASPAVAAGHVYLFSQAGDAWIVAAERAFRQVLHTKMPDSFHASPAFADGRIYLRGLTNLWCLSGTSPTPAAASASATPRPPAAP